MTAILQLNSSLFADEGKSSQLADAFVARWRRRVPDTRVIRRDLTDSRIPHLSLERFQAGLTASGERTAAQASEAALADTLIAELQAADILVIGVPIYNFHVPSTLKAWFDHVARAGTTFRYTPSGPEGLLRNKQAYVFTTSGGQHVGTETDFAAPYIRHFLGFLGIEDVTFTRAEGLAMGAEASREALASANRCIERLAA